MALFAWSGPARALTSGLVSGNRDVTLAWAAAGSGLIGHSGGELYLATSVFPIFMLPLLERWPIARIQQLRAAGCGLRLASNASGS